MNVIAFKMDEIEEDYSRQIKKLEEEFLENLKQGKDFEKTKQEFERKLKKAKQEFEKREEKKAKKPEKEEKKSQDKKKETENKEEPQRNIKKINLKDNFLKEKYYKQELNLYKLKRKLKELEENKSAIKIRFLYIKIKIRFFYLWKNISRVLIQINEGFSKNKQQIFEKIKETSLKLKNFIKNIIKKLNILKDKLKIKKTNEKKQNKPPEVKKGNKKKQ